MNEELTPERIYLDFTRSNINRAEATYRLITIIEESGNVNFRIESVKMLGKLAVQNRRRTFRILENCLISDEEPLIRAAAANELAQHFPKKGYAPLKSAIFQEKSVVVLKTLLELIANSGDNQIRTLKNDLLDRLSTIYGIVRDEVRFLLDLQVLFVIYELYDQNVGFDTSYFDSCNSIYELIYHKDSDGSLYYSVRDGHITGLDLSFQLKILPESIGLLSKLRYLRLEGTGLKKLPKSLGSLRRLEYLNLNGNKLKFMPNWVFSIAKRHYARKYVKEGVEKHEAPVLGLLEILTGFKLEKAKTSDKVFDPHVMLFYKIDDAGHIVEIYVFDPEIVSICIFPEQIYSLKFLETLLLSSQYIKVIPKSIGELTSLKHLDLSWNLINKIPKSITNLKSLEVLKLNRNGITQIPEDIGELKSLRHLDISYNSIKKIPKSITNLKSLKVLDLYRNRITQIPEDIGELTSLKHLDIRNNSIKKIPKSVTNLKFVIL